MNLESNLNIRVDDGIWADLEIINGADKAVKIFNTKNTFTPTEGWTASLEAYQIAVFQSINILEMKLHDSAMTKMEQTGIGTFADHIMGLPLELKPQEKITIPIPLNQFYKLEKDVDYLLEITFGEKDNIVRTRCQFKI